MGRPKHGMCQSQSWVERDGGDGQGWVGVTVDGRGGTE